MATRATRSPSRRLAANPVLLGVLFAAWTGGAPASEPTTESMRCGTRLIHVGDPKYEVLQRCGEPHSAAFVGERLRRYAIPRGPIHYSAEEVVPVEEWIYEMGYGRFIRVLTFEGNTLKTIRLGPRK